MKKLLIICLLFCALNAFAQDSLHTGRQTATFIQPLLPVPFGTITRLTVQVIDGDQLHRKAYEGYYLLKVKEINGRLLTDTTILLFTDETGKLAVDNYQLYYLRIKKRKSSLHLDEINMIKRGYVGNLYDIVAYETGRFTGYPEGYFDYQPLQTGTPYHFEHRLNVIAVHAPATPK